MESDEAQERPQKRVRFAEESVVVHIEENRDYDDDADETGAHGGPSGAFLRRQRRRAEWARAKLPPTNCTLERSLHDLTGYGLPNPASIGAESAAARLGGAL